MLQIAVRPAKSKFRIGILVICVLGILFFIYTYMTSTSGFHKQIWDKFRIMTKPLSFFHPEVTDSDRYKTSTSIDWENLTLNDPVLRKWKRVAYSPSTTMTLDTKKSSYYIGDVLTVTITVRDFRGRRIKRGGDEVRIWIRGPENDTSAAGYTLDKNDGSYLGKVKLFWEGNATIVARVATPREMVAFLYESVRSARTEFLIMALFEQGDVSEVTNCSPTLKHHLVFCNMTARNSGLPWYCDRPVNVSCDDWKSYGHNRSYYVPRKQEIEMFKRVHEYQTVEETITLTASSSSPDVHHANEIRHDLTPCNQLPSKDTWDPPVLGGYMYKDRWYSTQCRSRFDGSVESFKVCLSERKLWLIGDSTLRQVFVYLETLLQLNRTSEPWTTPHWHQPSSDASEDNTINVFWALHGMPVFYGRNFTYDLQVKGTHAYIDDVPANSKDIIVIHFYLHFVAFHPRVLRRHLRKTVRSIRALKKRAPDVKIIVKGPHAYHDEVEKMFGMGYDFWAIVNSRVVKEEFVSVVDDVIYLDLWEITVAAENGMRHPDDTLLTSIIDYMMSYVCP